MRVNECGVNLSALEETTRNFFQFVVHACVGVSHLSLQFCDRVLVAGVREGRWRRMGGEVEENGRGGGGVGEGGGGEGEGGASGWDQ